jgi:hypothetical protein
MDSESVTATALLLATGGVAVAVYEWFAVNRIAGWPTVTAIVKRLPVPVRVLIVLALSAASFDHFITGWAL